MSSMAGLEECSLSHNGVIVYNGGVAFNGTEVYNGVVAYNGKEALNIFKGSIISNTLRRSILRIYAGDILDPLSCSFPDTATRLQYVYWG